MGKGIPVDPTWQRDKEMGMRQTGSGGLKGQEGLRFRPVEK
jgi:hypothetical protein